MAYQSLNLARSEARLTFTITRRNRFGARSGVVETDKRCWPMADPRVCPCGADI